jgi:hypothetical protein
MADHENATASLGCSEVSPVHHPVGPPIPEVFQATEDGGCVASVVTLEKPFGILDDDPSGAGLVDETEVLSEESVELPEEAGSSASEPRTVGGGDAGVLAGEAADEEFRAVERGAGDVTDVSSQFDVGEVAAEDLLAVLVDLDHDLRLPAGNRVEADLEPADAGEGRGVLEGHGAPPKVRLCAIM